MTNSEKFNLDLLHKNLTFLFPDMKWVRYTDHVHSNFRKLDIYISIYHPECYPVSQFLMNYQDKYFCINDRDVTLLKSFDQLDRKLRAFLEMTKVEQQLLDLRQTW